MPNDPTLLLIVLAALLFGALVLALTRSASGGWPKGPRFRGRRG